ncbi:MAG: PIG-L family deacetylase [Verrucomicrobiae bacterium]|nr:PIG-L family deacetylase [Verrucomicrobiae bacterium]
MKKKTEEPLVALAVGAHPDDIEFMMAGTLLLLKEAGAEIHVWHLGDGAGGTAKLGRRAITTLRAKEARESARLAGAQSHGPLFGDLQIFYDSSSLARVSAVVREIKPNIILTHSPNDYMEDHQNTCRLVVTAAFSRGMINHVTQPRRPVCDEPVAIYHALPHGLRDGLGQVIRPDFFVNVAPVMDLKREMLACHRSQKEWLDVSQGMDAYLKEMERLGAEAGRMSRKFKYAEGWRCHSHLGFAASDYRPLQQLLGRKTCLQAVRLKGKRVDFQPADMKN